MLALKDGSIGSGLQCHETVLELVVSHPTIDLHISSLYVHLGKLISPETLPGNSTIILRNFDCFLLHVGGLQPAGKGGDYAFSDTIA